MPLRGPKGAVPSQKGWVNPKTGELLKAGKISPAQISEWQGHEAQAVVQPVIQTLHEAPVTETVVAQSVVDFHYDEEDQSEEE